MKVATNRRGGRWLFVVDWAIFGPDVSRYARQLAGFGRIVLRRPGNCDDWRATTKAMLLLLLIVVAVEEESFLFGSPELLFLSGK